jgi:hypothetical protein
VKLDINIKIDILDKIQNMALEKKTEEERFLRIA